MRFLILFSLAISLSSVSLAVSESKKKRGFSCTDLCTADGKDSVLMPGINETQLKEFCKGNADSGLASCTENCLEAGGFFSKWAGRKEQVAAYLAQGKDACKCFDACGSGAGQPGWDTKNPQGKMVTGSLEDRYIQKCSKDNERSEGNIHWCKNSCEGIINTKALDEKCRDMEESRKALRQ